MDARVARLQEDLREAKAARSRMESAANRIEATLAATLPHLTTGADLAQLEAKLAGKPDKTCMWGILAALLTAYTCGLAALK